MSKPSFKTYQEHWFVIDGQMKRSGSLSTTGNAVNLVDKQLGVVSADPFSNTKVSGEFLTGGETAAQVRQVQLVRGTTKSSDTSYHLGWEGSVESPFLRSPIIRPGNIKSVSCNIHPIAKYSSQVFTGTWPTFAVSTEYSIFPVLKSIRKDSLYSQKEDDFSEAFTTPASFSGVTDNTHYVLTNLLHRLNLQSNQVRLGHPTKAFGKRNFFAFATDTDGGGTGTALSAISVGTVVPVMTYDGVTINYTATKEFVNTIKAWVDNSVYTASTKIININKSNAASGNSIDGFVLMGLDEVRPLAKDFIYSVRTEVNAKLGGGFVSNGTQVYTAVKACGANSDFGEAVILQMQFDENARLQVNQTAAGHSDTVIKAPSYIDATKSYVTDVIEITEDDENTTGSIQHQVRIYLLREREENSAGIKAKGWIRVINNAAIATDVITVGGVALTEGTDWNDGASAALTAASLAAQINADVATVSATAVNEYIYLEAVTAGTAGNSLNLLYTDTGSNGPAVTLSGATLAGGAAASSATVAATTGSKDKVLVGDLNATLGAWILSSANKPNLLGSTTDSTLFV